MGKKRKVREYAAPLVDAADAELMIESIRDVAICRMDPDGNRENVWLLLEDAARRGELNLPQHRAMIRWIVDVIISEASRIDRDRHAPRWGLLEAFGLEPQ